MIVYQGRVFSVEVDRRRFPNGREHDVVIVRHPPSVVLIPIEADDRVVLVKQYRAPIDRETWELPAGSVEPGESAEAAGLCAAVPSGVSEVDVGLRGSAAESPGAASRLGRVDGGVSAGDGRGAAGHRGAIPDVQAVSADGVGGTVPAAMVRENCGSVPGVADEDYFCAAAEGAGGASGRLACGTAGGSTGVCRNGEGPAGR